MLKRNNGKYVLTINGHIQALLIIPMRMRADVVREVLHILIRKIVTAERPPVPARVLVPAGTGNRVHVRQIVRRLNHVIATVIRTSFIAVTGPGGFLRPVRTALGHGAALIPPVLIRWAVHHCLVVQVQIPAVNLVLKVRSAGAI